VRAYLDYAATAPVRAYLDYAATAPMRPRALQVMAELAEGAVLGNPSGGHWAARAAKEILEESRERFACILGCSPSEIVFTSGGTESDNLAVAGAGPVPLCSAVEHHAVLSTCLSRGGRTVAVDRSGRVDLDSLAAELGDDVSVVSVMAANNETGVVNDLKEVAALVASRGGQRSGRGGRALLHCDAVQAFPWLEVDRLVEVCDLVSLSAHKFGGPPGVGVLVVRRGVRLEPVMHGGGQENGLRSGTPPVAAIAAAAAAAEDAWQSREADSVRVAELGKRLASNLLEKVPGAALVGAGAPRTPAIYAFIIDGVENEELLVMVDGEGVAASAGASCSSGALQPSHVLSAMGYDSAQCRSMIRLSLGWASRAEEVDHATEAIASAVARLRESMKRPTAVLR
jgi:cysteine desulfurase